MKICTEQNILQLKNKLVIALQWTNYAIATLILKYHKHNISFKLTSHNVGLTDWPHSRCVAEMRNTPAATHCVTWRVSFDAHSRHFVLVTERGCVCNTGVNVTWKEWMFWRSRLLQKYCPALYKVGALARDGERKEWSKLKRQRYPDCGPHKLKNFPKCNHEQPIHITDHYWFNVSK